MPGSIEHQLLSQVLATRDFNSVEKFKITEDHFFSPECKQVFNFLSAHYHNVQTYGQVPSQDLVTSIHRNFQPVYTADSIQTLAWQLRLQNLKYGIDKLAADVVAMAATNPEIALATLREEAAKLVSANSTSKDHLLVAAHDELLNEYHLVANGHGVTGIPFPWEVLNEETQGMHKGEYIVIYGRPKSMKTWCALNIATHAYHKANQRVLVYSMEMHPFQVLRRCAALIAGIDYGKFRKAQLNQVDYNNLFQILNQLKTEEAHFSNGPHHPSLMVTGKDSRDGGGVSHLQAKIREFQPDLVVIDGQYLMRDDRMKVRTIDWKAQAHISQDLKETAQLFEIPIIGVTQANRGSKKDDNNGNGDLSGISYADALGQDCDLAMMVQKQIDPATMEPEIVLRFPGTREMKMDAFVIHGVPATNFSFKRTMVADPAQNQPQQATSGGGGKQQIQRPPSQPAAVIPQINR